MYKPTALVALAAGFALAAPKPQTGTLCNPLAVPQGPFQIGGYNPIDSTVHPLAIGEVSRGAKILVVASANPVNTATNFTFDQSTGNLCAADFGCDDGATTEPLLFGSPGPSGNPNGVPEGGFTLKAGDGCFTDPDQSPLFLVADDGAGVSAENDWAGWVLCSGLSGSYWVGAGAAPEGCSKVGLQLHYHI